jgi:hypothetical protein
MLMEVTSMFGPKLTVVAPLKNPVPVTFTVRLCPLDPEAGATADIVGAGLPTIKPFVSVAVPPPRGGFVTTMFRAPSAAPAATTRLAASCVGLATATELTVIPEPKTTVVDPEEKFVPAMVTVTTSPRDPVAGEALIIVGTRFSTLKADGSVAFPPPGVTFVTLTPRAPVTVFGSIVMLAVRLVGLVAVTAPTVMPRPNSTLVTPLMKFAPMIDTRSVCPLPPETKLTLVRVGAGLLTTNASANVALPPPGALFVSAIEWSPTAALDEIVMLTLRCVPAVSTFVEFTVMPAPKSALVTPL